MGLSLANPAALWALLGLPLILGIHFLQSRNRREVVSSLFLLELLPEETRSGAVFTYIRNGLQLWLQLLAVLLFTLILTRPMRIREDSLQSVVVVVDSSVSMQAFQKQTVAELRRIAEILEGSSAKTEWWLLPSDPAYPGIVRAGSRETLLNQFGQLQHRSGPHSPRSALIRARQLSGPEGLVIYLSDHVLDNPPVSALAVSVGQPIPNSGITGMKIGEETWEASVLHFGSEPVTRNLQVAFDGKVAEQRDVELFPGAVKVLGGKLPPEYRRGMLRLEEDAYAVDDLIPFVKPKPKPLGYSVELRDAGLKKWVDRLMATVPASSLQDSPTLRWMEGWPMKNEHQRPAEIWFLNGSATAGYEVPVQGSDSIAEGLGWEGFLALPYAGFHLLPSDTVQLWMGEHPLVVLREGAAGVRLLLNFEWESSNAGRFPSFLLLLHRFIREQQSRQLLPFSTQLETRQLLPASFSVKDSDQIMFISTDGEPHPLRSLTRTAPDQPGYLSVTRGEDLQFIAGVFPGDVAEGNFLTARSQPFPNETVKSVRMQNSQKDFLMPLWFCLLVGTLSFTWYSGQSSSFKS